MKTNNNTIFTTPSTTTNTIAIKKVKLTRWDWLSEEDWNNVTTDYDELSPVHAPVFGDRRRRNR